VYPGAQDVDPRAEPMMIDAQHSYIIGISAAGASSTVAAFVTSRHAPWFR
jgi:hypothetical protein